LVILAGLEEGLFPHSRTLNNPEELEEERRLCYVGMTRAMNTLILTRAHYRRRYGNDAPEMSIPSRFLEEVPSTLVENLGGQSGAWAGARSGYNSYASGYGSARRPSRFSEFADQHYNYEDESQESSYAGTSSAKSPASRTSNKPFVASWMTANARPSSTAALTKPGAPGPASGIRESTTINASNDQETAPPDARSIDNIARFFGGKGAPAKPGAFARPSIDIPNPTGAANLAKGQRVRHAKYGDGTVLIREGEGEDAKLTVMFARHGMKKLMEKFANLQKI
jgi:DNA helicase-2/ATP-dependent DNA helicase PcrA